MILYIFFLLALLFLQSKTQQTPLQIFFVSGNPALVTNPVSSSLRGERLIYIKAVGHSPNPSQNLVYVGTYPCQIPSDGVTDTYISCKTADTRSVRDINNLAVTLISGGSSVSTYYPNTVYYQSYSTPELTDVFPSAGFGGLTVSFYGIHRISNLGDGLRNMGDVVELLLGDDLCNRFDIYQAPINANAQQYITCVESSIQEGGKYNVSEVVVPGKANNNIFMRRGSFNASEYFQFTVLPTVSAVSPTYGNIGGQYLTISGTGFSINPQNNTVTVDGNICTITSASSAQLQCTLGVRNTSFSTLLPTNSSSQANGYFSGAGVQYLRFTLGSSINSMSQLVAAVRAWNTVALGLPQEAGFRADIREADVHGSYYAQTWSGYFTAPVSGTYTFRGCADDVFSFYLAQTYGSAASAQLPSAPLIYSNSHQRMRDLYNNDYPTAEATATLVGGMSYYFEAYHINYGGVGFLDLAVDVPNSNNATFWQVYEVDKIQTTSTIQPQVVIYSMAGGFSGIIQLQIQNIDPSTFAITYNQLTNVTYGCSASSFQSALNTFRTFSSYQISVVRNIYDNNSNIITNLSQAAKIDYVVSINLMRPTEYQTQKFSIQYFNYSGLFTTTSVQQHSPLISGTFTLSIGGVPISVSGSLNIPYNVAPSSLQTGIVNSGIVGFGNVQVTSNSDCGYACTWIIYYKGFNGPIPSIVVNGAGLTGGSTTPNISCFIRRNYSTNIQFDPVDYRFLNTYNSGLNVQVMTNRVPSVCTGTCNYAFYTYSQITELSYSGSVLSLAFSNPTNLTIPISSIYILVGGQPCLINAGSTLRALSCNMSINSDSSPILVAGMVTPAVYIQPYGIAALGSGVSSLSVGLLTRSLSVTQGGNNGGYLISLYGHGFPSDNTKISISICGNPATIQAVTNIQVKFYVPSCSSLGSFTVNVTSGSASNNSLSFTYTNGSLSAATINSLSPASANPAMKGKLVIQGNLFGNDSSQVTVFLSNATGKIYRLKVLTLSDSVITAGLPGGGAGQYIVQVNLNTTGDSVAGATNSNIFTYQFSISSVSPAAGSYYGGTLLMLTGVNFVNDTTMMQVYIGDTLNWNCNIQAITSTQILCRTPPISPDYTVGTGYYVVAVTQLILQNICTGTCNFTYISMSDSPSLTGISSSVTNVGTITLSGMNLLDGSNFTSVSLTNNITGSVIVLSATTNSNSSLTFSITSSIPSAPYRVRVRNAIGESNPLALSVNWNPGTTSWANGGSTAGGIVSLNNGAGYPAAIDGATYSVTISAGSKKYPVNIVSCCLSNSISLVIPPAPSGTYFTINFVGPVNTNGKTYNTNSFITAAARITSPTNLSVGTNTITFAATNSYSATINSITLVSLFNSTFKISVNSSDWTTSGSGVSAITTISVSLSAGSYNLVVGTSPYGNLLISDIINVYFPINVATTPHQMSFSGGTFTVSAIGLSPVSYIKVSGLQGRIISYSNTQVTYQVPALVTSASQSAFNIASVSLLNTAQFSYFSDQNASINNVSAAFDGLVNTFYGSPNPTCWIGIDAGYDLQISVSRVRFSGDLSWANVASQILYSVFQGSNDMANWNNLTRIDQTVHSGWNVFASSDTSPYRYVRFLHNATSQCNLAQIQLYGIVYSNLTASLSSQFANITYLDGFNTHDFINHIEYRQDQTSIVTSISPRYGDINGGYTLNLTGINLNASNPVIIIDGLNCPITANTSTLISCTVPHRPTTPSTANTFTVTVGNSNVILRDTFLYVLRWSDPKTWGVSIPPVNGDLIFIPLGTTLLVDQNTPVLQGIAVQSGTLIFCDDMDLVVQTGFITMNGGSFIAGIEAFPHTHQLKFIMYGGYYGKQQPMFGNKGIGCLNCHFSMYGTPRITTWTTLAATIEVGANSFTVNDAIDWQVGEIVAVASTSFIHTEAEEMTITAVNNRTITVGTPFKNRHVSIIEKYGSSDQLVMQAQVGLLTRNIKVIGDPSSTVSQYGAHLMLTGQSSNGFLGQVAYSQFTLCGQPQILGRYCIHFHMAGDIPTSYARGNSVHHSFARVITIHGVHYLTVEKNVGYRVKGHNYFVEDGIETHNIIRHNLAISSLTVTNMLQTDISVASFWVTNPTNDFYGNHAAGSDFYGIWYEIKANPDGPSATMDVCPMGNPLGYVANNVGHSNIRFGLRIFILYSRLYPCQPIRNNSDPNSPQSYNPSIASVFSNFTLYKNLEDGVLAEQTGNVIFNNFIIAENYKSGVQFYLANFTKEPPLVNNTVIIGMSTNNANSNITNYTNGMSGVITGRSGNHLFTKVRFYNFPAGSLLMQTCSMCTVPDIYTNLGSEITVKQISFSNVTGKILFMIGMKRDVIYDLDGSFSQPFDGNFRPSATILHGYNHIANYHQDTCTAPLNANNWDNAVMCNSTVTVRRVVFTNLLTKSLFVGQSMKVAEISSINQTIDPNISNSLYTSVVSHLPNIVMEPEIEKPVSWSLPFITGQTYAVWWGTGIDYSHLSIFTTPIFNPEDLGIIFKFNYSQNRELFRIGPMRGGARQLTALDYISESPTYLDVQSCSNGQYYHNNEVGPARMMEICQSGKNRTAYQYTEINAVICQFLCPAPAGTFVRENFIRLWSNVSQWPNSSLPKAGDNVTLNGNWTVKLDVDPAPLNYFVIDGAIVADDTRNVNITANSIHIRAGSITAGSPAAPFLHNFTIQINGQKTDSGFYIDPNIAGNKYMVVTGQLNLYGLSPATVTTHLTQSAFAGTNLIYVASSSGWKVSDTLVLSPSFSAYSQYQIVTITSVNSNGSISIASPLAHTHYGSSSLTIDNNYGTLDTRTQVGHANRNIQIVPGPDAGWGFTVIVYGFIDGTIRRIGSVQLSGVQFVSGGQLDTLNAPLTFINSRNSNTTSLVTTTSFLNCKAHCVYITNSQNITITNNILYNVWVIGIEANTVLSVVISSNLIIGVSERPTLPEGSQLVACIALYQYVNPAIDGTLITDNYCAGSSQHGFAFAHIKCNELQTNPFANNTVGTATVGFILNTIGEKCQAFSYAKAFACTIGQICGAPGINTIMFSQFIMADNGRGVTLKLGDAEGNSNHTAYLTNSYITALSRPNCAQCYGSSATTCSGLLGMRMFTPSNNGEQLPGKFGPGFDVICKQPVYDAKSFLYNNTFDYFRQTYTGAASVCSNNFVFRPHSSAFDQSGGVNLFDSQCTHCDNNSYLLADPPNPAFFGWFGGCGDILCTGLQNYLIQDHDGSFLGTPGTIIPNNSVIATNETGCVFSSSMNAYTCKRSDFAVLEYQNIAADYKTRIMWPVNLTYDGGNYTTITNGWREWDWLGSQPQNHRFGRFLSIIRLGQVYNMTFASKAPLALQLQLQLRSPQGNMSNYIVVRLYYPLPNSIRLSLNGSIVQPILLTDPESGAQQNLNLSQCGSNFYFYTNYTVEFVITETPGCILVVQPTDSIQLTTHFSMDINQFYANSSIGTTFISRLCALLDITDMSTVKIVGVFSGSTNIVTTIEQSTAPNAPPISSINKVLQASLNSNSYSQAISGGSLGSVITASAVFNPLSSSSSSNSSTISIGVIIGIVFGVIVLVILVLGGMYVMYRRNVENQKMTQFTDDAAVESKEMVTPNKMGGKDDDLPPEQQVDDAAITKHRVKSVLKQYNPNSSQQLHKKSDL